MLFTRCPECDTTFRVTDETLKKANGQVRCGRCASVFNAYAELHDPARSRTSRSSRRAAPREVRRPHRPPQPKSRAAATRCAARLATDRGPATPHRACGSHGAQHRRDVRRRRRRASRDRLQRKRPPPARGRRTARRATDQRPRRSSACWRPTSPRRCRRLVFWSSTWSRIRAHRRRASSRWWQRRRARAGRARRAGDAPLPLRPRRACDVRAVARAATYRALGAEITPRWDMQQYEILDWIATAEPNTRGLGSLKSRRGSRIAGRCANRIRRFSCVSRTVGKTPSAAACSRPRNICRATRRAED